MADTRYLFFPKDAHAIRPNGKIVQEEVLVDEDAEPVEGEKPATKKIPFIRSMAWFIETFIITHPLFAMRRGHAAFAAGLRILDIAKANKDSAGKWVKFERDDTNMIKKCFSAPKNKKDDRAEDLCAADMREMTQFESIMYRKFIASCMSPVTEIPEVESPEPPSTESPATSAESKKLPEPVEATEAAAAN